MVSAKKKMVYGIGGAVILAAAGFGIFSHMSNNYDASKAAVSVGHFKGDYQNKKKAINGGILKVSMPGTASDPATFVGYTELTETAAVAQAIAPGSNEIFYTDKDGRVENDGPASMKVDKDKKTVTITLRDNLKWSDGKDVTAKDVAFSLETIATNEVASANFSDSYLNIKGMQDFQDGKAKSISGLKFDNGENGKKLTLSYDRIPGSITWGDGLPAYALPYHDLKDVPSDQLAVSDKVTKHPLSFSAFKVSSVSTDSVVKYVRNDTYWGKKAKLDGITYYINEDQSKLENDLSKQKFDLVTGVPTTLWKDGNKDKLAKFDNAKGYASTGAFDNGHSELNFNLGHYDKSKKSSVQDRKTPLQDANVRKAVGYAMNVGDVAAKYGNGFSQATNSIVSKSQMKSLFYNKDVKGYQDKASGDAKKAGQYLEKAGYKKESDGYYYKDGKKLTLTYMARSGSTTAEATTKAYIAAWKAAGIDVKLYQDKLVDFSTWKSLMLAGNNNEWDMTMVGWSEGKVPSFGQVWSKQSPMNMGHIVSDKVSKSLEDAQDAQSDEDLIKSIKGFQKLVIDDEAYTIPTTTGINASLVNGRVTGWTEAPTNDIFAKLGVSADKPQADGNPRK